MFVKFWTVPVWVPFAITAENDTVVVSLAGRNQIGIFAAPCFLRLFVDRTDGEKEGEHDGCRDQCYPGLAPAAADIGGRQQDQDVADGGCYECGHWFGKGLSASLVKRPSDCLSAASQLVKGASP